MKWYFVVIATVAISCGSKPEGLNPADCSDSKDNDNDGRYDCDDDGCLGNDFCVGKKRLAEVVKEGKKKTSAPQVMPAKTLIDKKKADLGPYFQVGPILVQSSQNGENISWMDAKQYCATLNLAGNQEWRLPTQEEAVKIVESGILTHEPSYVMWTSTMKGAKRAVIVGITGGAVNHLAVQSKGECRARCVRDAI